MCGLFGIIGQGITKDDTIVFRDLMLLNAIRGTDSTGFASGRSKANHKNLKEIYLSKKVNDAIYFLQSLSKEDEDALDNVFHDFKLGHTRWATTGEVVLGAAQPFNRENIVGTHNGTFGSINFTGFNSDSDAFYHRVNELGMRATIQTVKPKEDGYALVWHDKNEGTIKILRNEKKMIWFTYHPTRQVMYYCSELGLLKAALDRRSIKYEDCFYPMPDTMYSFDPQRLKKGTKPTYTAAIVKPFSIETLMNEPANHAGAPFDGGKTMEGPNVDL